MADWIRRTITETFRPNVDEDRVVKYLRASREEAVRSSALPAPHYRPHGNEPLEIMDNGYLGSDRR